MQYTSLHLYEFLKPFVGASVRSEINYDMGATLLSQNYVSTSLLQKSESESLKIHKWKNMHCPNYPFLYCVYNTVWSKYFSLKVPLHVMCPCILLAIFPRFIFIPVDLISCIIISLLFPSKRYIIFKCTESVINVFPFLIFKMSDIN